MENYSKAFITFLVSYISSHSDNPKTSEALVKRMMRMKNVQKIIIDTMSQLSSIIYQEILSIENIKTTTFYKIPPKNSKLLTLAEDVKNILNNYIFIQSKVSDMREIIDNFDEHIDISDESKQLDPLYTSAYHFLNAIPPNQVISNDEIEEISNELWSKQLEVETMLKIEVNKLRQFQNTIGNRFFYKNDFIKTKAGLKMKAMEEEKEKMKQSFQEEIERLKLSYEEILSFENEKNLNEDKRISKLFDPSTIRDLPGAIVKIKELLGIKLIYEKKRCKDEKLIKGLNNKLQLLIDSYSNLSEKHDVIEQRFEELKRNHENLVETSNIISPKNRERRLISKQDSLKFDPIRPEVIFSEFSVKKNDNIVDVKGFSSKARNESIKIYRTEPKIDKNKRISPRKKLRTATPAGRPILANLQQIQKSQEKQENAIQEFKQALIVIDENFKKTNKALTENLEDLVGSNVDMEIQEESKNLAEKLKFEIKDNKIVSDQSSNIRSNPQILSPQATDSSLIADIPPKLMHEKEMQVEKLCLTNQASQTVSKFLINISSLFRTHKSNLKLSGKTEADLENILIEVFSHYLREVKDSTCQSEKETTAPIELKMSSNELIKGLLKRDKRSSYPKDDNDSKENSIIEKIIKLPVFSEQKIEDIKENQINQLVMATKEYKKEFVIQTQLKGYKKLEFGNIQTLWEEIINRRISEGEQDKISVYLRGLLGTKNFENEKKSVIEMIESSKLHNISSFSASSNKPSKSSKKPIQNWKKLLTSLIISKLSLFTESIQSQENPVDKLFEASKKIKFIKHRIIRRSNPRSKVRHEESDTFGFTKSDKWRVRSVTPTLVETARVKSRYMNTRRNHTNERFQRPMTKIIQYRDSIRSPSRY